MALNNKFGQNDTMVKAEEDVRNVDKNGDNAIELNELLEYQFGHHTTPSSCPSGMYWDASTNTCITSPSTPTTCPSGTHWNVATATTPCCKYCVPDNMTPEDQEIFNIMKNMDKSDAA